MAGMRYYARINLDAAPTRFYAVLRAPTREGFVHQFASNSIDPRPSSERLALRAANPGSLALRPRHGGQPYAPEFDGCTRAGHPRRCAAPLRAGRAFHGRLHRFRDRAAGAGAGAQTGIARHVGKGRYDRAIGGPARQDRHGAGQAILQRFRRLCFLGWCMPCGGRMRT